MIQRFQRCRGLSFPSLGKWKLEIWLCPRGEVIPDHSHPHCTSHIVYFWGHLRGHIDHHYREFSLHDLFRVDHIPAGMVHGAVVLSRFWLFANLGHWTVKPTSAVEDYEPK